VSIRVELTAVVVTVTGDTLRVLTVDRDGLSALPSGPLEESTDRTIDRAMRTFIADGTGLQLGFVEQLYTFGDVARDPASTGRSLAMAYLALTQETAVSPGATWVDLLTLLPWEDHRTGRSLVEADVIEPGLRQWLRRAGRGRATLTERVELAWGWAGASWDPVRVLERYELLWQAGLVAEAGGDDELRLRGPMALDHRRILASALGRLRGKLTYRPVVFELLPPTFTLLQLQRVVEALSGVRVHKQNFRRLVETGGLVEGTGKRADASSGRPAELFRFRREVSRERPAPGVGLPGRR
jgi:hypothetical protein